MARQQHSESFAEISMVVVVVSSFSSRIHLRSYSCFPTCFVLYSFLYIQKHMIFISLRGIYSLLFFLVVVVKTTEKNMKERLTRLILFFI